MAFLVVREPERVAFTVALGETCCIGRDATNDVALADAHVSRMHARIVGDAGCHKALDLDSRHGTFVNGARVTLHTLHDGDRLQVGKVELSYHAHDQPDRPVIASLTAAGMVAPEVAGADARRLRLLHDVSRLIGSGDERDDLPSKVLERAIAGLGGENGLVGVVERPGSLRRIACRKPDKVLPHAVLEAVLRRSESVLVAEGGQHAVGAPLLAGTRVLGLIYVTRKAVPFTIEDRAFLDVTAQLMAAAMNHGERENRLLRVAEALREPDDELLGDSEPLLALRERMYRYASAHDTTVLIRGESGTGKGLVARRLHAHSPRADGPFVAVNCAAIPDTLIESELFGHDKGAFTGATRAVRGKFALAHGGTIFLDEVGDLSPSAQAKVLRVVEEREIQPLGSEQTIDVDVRILSATHRSLEEEIAGGRFRSDLYYRLAVVELTVPPLRARGDDIVLLADVFLQRAAVRLGRRVQGFTPAAREVLLRYGWPGNVRQLANEVERALLLGDADLIDLDDLRARMDRDTGAVVVPAGRSFADAEREVLQRALDEADGNIRGAARALEMSRNTLYRKLRKYKLIGD
jgi:DNA-binding NtrC family response regulator